MPITFSTIVFEVEFMVYGDQGQIYLQELNYSRK